MILIDYSHTYHTIAHANKDVILRKEMPLDELFRKSILTSIKHKIKKFQGEYGKNVVIAYDGNAIWRKDIFPTYKGNRKKIREESELPWKEIKEAANTILTDIQNYFPYRVIGHDKAEADDVMSCVADIVAANPIKVGLEEMPEPLIGITGDKDMKQMLKYDNVRLYSSRFDKFLTLDGMSSKEFLRRLILTGDSGDFVPNVFSPENSLADGIRQKPCTETKMKPFLEAVNMMDACYDDVVRERVIMNTRLISFGAIPKYIRDSVSDQYYTKPIGTKMMMFNYLNEHDCQMLLNDIHNF